MKRYGFIPGSRSPSDGLSASFNHGLDAGIVIDQLKSRIKDLEDSIFEDSQPHSQVGSTKPSVGILSQNSQYTSRHNQRLRPLDLLRDTVQELQSKMQQCENDIRDIQGRVPTNRTESTETASSKEELKILKKKLKEFCLNTSRGFKTTSSGISDIQKSSLYFYDWAGKVHSAMHIISQKAGLPMNPCPEIQLPSDKFIGCKKGLTERNIFAHSLDF